MLVLFGEGLSNDEDRVADEGQGGGQRHPLEDTLLRLGDMIVGRLLDKVAGGVGGGQQLAARASGGGLSDISIRIRGDDAAGGEGGQEEDEDKQRIGVLQDGDGARQALGEGLRGSHGGEEERERRSETARGRDYYPRKRTMADGVEESRWRIRRRVVWLCSRTTD